MNITKEYNFIINYMISKITILKNLHKAIYQIIIKINNNNHKNINLKNKKLNI